MRILRILLALFAFAILADAASAQTLTGKWTARYPMRIRNENGAFSADTGVAMVTLEQKGDSVSGTWLPQNTPTPSQPRPFTGTFKNGSLQITAAPMEAKINRDGNVETVQMQTFFEGKLEGDRLAGTMHSESADGSISSPPMPWSAERQKD